MDPQPEGWTHVFWALDVRRVATLSDVAAHEIVVRYAD
jgi:hypothetical protein